MARRPRASSQSRRIDHLLFRPAAAADLEDAFRWYERRRAGLGTEFLDDVARAMAEIGDWPLRFPVVLRETRRALLSRFPFGVYYRVLPDRILVVACLHVSRDPARWKARG